MSKLLKVLAATAAGFVAGVLVAPKSGKETRADLKAKAEEKRDEVTLKANQAKAAASAAAESVKKGAGQVELEARGMAQSAKNSATVMRDEAGRLGAEAKVRAARVADTAKETTKAVDSDVKASQTTTVAKRTPRK